MATLTITIDPAVLEAAKCEAERRQLTLDEFIAQSLSNLPPNKPADDFGHAELIALMARAPLGVMGKPLTRDEIYAERTWPLSETKAKTLLELMNEGALGDLGKLPTREEIYEERTWPHS